MRKHTRIFLLISLVLILLISLAACNIPFINPGEPGDTISIPKYYHVVFMVDGEPYCKPIPYLSNTTAKLPNEPTPPEGQDFLGWYLGEEEFTQEDFTTLLLNNKEKAVNKENIVLVAKFGILNTFTLTFDETTCGVIAPITEKEGRSIVSKKPNLTKPGFVPNFYTIVDGVKTDFTFDKMPNHDITVYVEWISIIFTITFDEATCGIIDPIIEEVGTDITSRKPGLVKPGYAPNFYILVDGVKTEFVFDTMPDHDVTVYLEWYTNATVNYYGNGKLLQTFVVPGAEIYNVEIVQAGEKLYNPDFKFDGWYLDPECNNKLTTETIELQPIVNLYGKYTNRSFIDRINEFANTSFEKPYVIKDEYDFAQLLDYISFNNIYATVIDGKASGGVFIKTNDFDTLIDKAMSLSTGPTYSFSPYSYPSYPGLYYIGLTTDITAEKTKTTDPTTSVQCSSAIVPIVTSKRDVTFDNFKINEKEEFYKEISTSNQLFYAMQYGYKPKCVPGSIAEDMLNKAKAILRECVDDTMSDFEKVYAIYCWMVLNVDYDHKAVYHEKHTAGYNPINAEAWHMEGVFNSHLAVCDGISKAMVVLCRLEGIPCIRVIGPQHAWNKVYLDVDGEENVYTKQWYSIDATWGDLNVNDSYTYLNYDNFLIRDVDKKNQSSQIMPCDNHLDIVANTSVNVYPLIKFDDKNDLHIDSQAEFEALIKYLYAYVNKNNDVTKLSISIDTAKGYNITDSVLIKYRSGKKTLTCKGFFNESRPGTAKTYILSVA